MDGKKVPESFRAALGRIRICAAGDALAADDYARSYRNQFHASTRRGWSNDPNGMVFHEGKYHLSLQGDETPCFRRHRRLLAEDLPPEIHLESKVASPGPVLSIRIKGHSWCFNAPLVPASGPVPGSSNSLHPRNKFEASANYPTLTSPVRSSRLRRIPPW